MNGTCDLQCRRQIVPCGVKLCRLVNGCDDHRVVAEGTSISDQRNAVLKTCDRPVDVRYDADYVDPLKTLPTSVRGCLQCVRRESAYTNQHCNNFASSSEHSK